MTACSSGLAYKLHRFFKKTPLKQSQDTKAYVDEYYVTHNLDIYKLPKNIDKAAARIVKSLEYLEEEYENIAKN